ncbi:MAG: hypothetical protein M3Q14_04510 [bacterium]|nr:hypothetical protein [bacterium]
MRLRELSLAVGSLITKHTILARDAFATPPDAGQPDLWTAYLMTAAELSGPDHTIKELVRGTETFLLENGVKITEDVD